ncbi:MAG: hypothetical protein GY861_17825 [bacterium]|nr:hypothetical protein [bacterium]
MLTTVLSWMLKSQGAKTASAAASGSVVSVAVLMGVMDQNADKKIESVKKEMLVYVDSRHNQVSTDMRYIRENQREIKELVKTINQRVYELNQRSKEY